MTSPTVPVSLPAWAREIDLSLPLHPQILLTGNVRDLYPVQLGEPDEIEVIDLAEMIWVVCEPRGYAALVALDPVSGELVPRLPDGADPPQWLDPYLRGALDSARLSQLLVAVVRNRDAPVGLLIPYAARIAPVDGMLDPVDRALLARAEALGHQAAPTSPTAAPDGKTGRSSMPPYNTVFWVCERQDELHGAFAVASPALRVIPVPLPTLDVRTQAAAGLFPDMDAMERRTRGRALAEATHGMIVRDVQASGRLARDRGMPADGYGEAARLLQIGVTDDPWTGPQIRANIARAEAYLNERVLGQESAVRKAVDVLMRSAVGLNGAHVSSSPNRPRGVLFLAGPTGVGKTELAKGIASLVLGEDAAPLRFDMSEFRADEAHQRLIGAPPGYVGYDHGGELTNAVRANPVCVLLFDEIDKAHDRIFDLFLQILEDGRLTDGRGATVYFTECFLVFTSNLGVTRPVGEGRNETVTAPAISYDTPRSEMEEVLRQAFVDFFNQRLGRPELRNRFGDSYVALDYIRPHVAPMIIDKALRAVANRVAKVHDLRLVYSERVIEAINDLAIARLPDGGRGINIVIESAVVNPLARWLFEKNPGPGTVVTLTSMTDVDGEWHVEIG